MVELEAVLLVIAGKDERDTKRPQTTVLGVALLQITEPLNELLDRNLFVVCEKVSLCAGSCPVDENVGVCIETGHTANDVPMRTQQERNE